MRNEVGVRQFFPPSGKFALAFQNVGRERVIGQCDCGYENISINQKRSVALQRAVFITLIIQARGGGFPPPPPAARWSRLSDSALCFHGCCATVHFQLTVRIVSAEPGGLTHSFLKHC